MEKFVFCCLGLISVTGFLCNKPIISGIYKATLVINIICSIYYLSGEPLVVFLYDYAFELILVIVIAIISVFW